MKTIYCFFLSLFFLSFGINGQSLDDQKEVRQVYNRLISSIGDMSRTPPDLQLVDSKQFVAQYIPNRNLIQFESAALDICRKMGTDSMNGVAFILAHELGHYYRNHSWLSEAGSQYASTDMGERLANAKVVLDSLEKNEAEADEFACFYSKLAGYSIKNTDNLLNGIYRGYNLPDTLKKYPMLKERQAIANRIRIKTFEWNELYNIANVLLVSGEIESAVFVYHQILNKGFGSREIYNNVGVARALEGLRYVGPEDKKIFFPFELDLSSRLSEQARGFEDGDSLKAFVCFSDAIDQFERSYQLDKTYLPAQLNLAICKALSGDMDEATFRIQKIKNYFKPCSKADSMKIMFTSNTIEFLEGKRIEARVNFKTLAAKGYLPAIRTIENFDRSDSVSAPTNYMNCTISIEDQILPLDIQQSEFRKSGFSGSNGSLSFYKHDTLSIEYYLLDFRGPGGFRRVFNLYKSPINNSLTQKSDFIDCGEPTLTDNVGSDRLKLYRDEKYSFCVFEELNQESYSITLKR